MKKTSILMNLPGRAISKAFFILISIILVTSCSKDDNENIEPSYQNGIFILNEGAWGNSNAEVTFVNSKNYEARGDIFKKANGSNTVLGDVLTDMLIDDEDAFLVLNASNYITVVDKETFKWKTNIEGLNNPRFISNYKDHLYVTQWGIEKGEVIVINKKEQKIVGSIEAGKGPEGIMVYNDLIWVANSGGFMNDNSVFIIDPSTNQVINQIETPDGPTDFCIDKEGNIWVLCYGMVSYDQNTYEIIEESPSYLIQISANTYDIIKKIKIGDHSHPSHMNISNDGKTIYILDDLGIYTVSLTSETFPQDPFIENDGTFYNFSLNPKSDEIWISIVPTWTSGGSVKILNSNSGHIIQSIDQAIGIGPSKILFQY